LGVGIEYHLNHAGTISDIEKNNTTMVTATMYPSDNLNVLLDLRGIELTAIVTAHLFFPVDRVDRS
jgi:hypothetical protein